MSAPEGGAAPRPSPAKPLTDLDFHSGAHLAELNQLVQELGRRDPGVRAAPELAGLKDFVFSLLARMHGSAGRLPSPNEYLLLSGGARQGSVDLSPGALGRYAPGADYDADYTLLVPVLQARGCPVTLDMRRCPPGHAWLPAAPFGPEACRLWADCCRRRADDAYLSPGLVAAWFSQALAAAAGRAAPRPGGPAVERVTPHGGLVTLLLRHGGRRALYDVLPVVAFQGWPAVAGEWLGRAHFWDGKLREADVAGGFYLLPAPGPGEASGLAWRLAFSRSELHLKKVVPPPLLQAYRAARAALSGAWGGQAGPYHLWSRVLWACDRLPARYLSQEGNAAHCLLGLLDDMAAGLAAGSCPNYFLPGCNRLQGVSEPELGRAVVAVRGDPAGHLRQAVERAKVAAKVGRGPDAGPPAEE